MSGVDCSSRLELPSAFFDFLAGTTLCVGLLFLSPFGRFLFPNHDIYVRLQRWDTDEVACHHFKLWGHGTSPD